MSTLSESVWRERQANHVERMTPFAVERTERMARLAKHPVRDFLFQYYAYRPAQLLRWSPGFDVLLEGAKSRNLEWTEFAEVPGGTILRADHFQSRRVSFLRWATDYLEGIAARPALFGCFGLHEWAMVYRSNDPRHSRTPLRLSPREIACVVESENLCCTHFDAFRFFTPEASPRNRLHLTREVTDQFDQKGCIHVTMDLYRYAHKLSPWTSGELIADTFELAWKARELDMRASPYDLSAYGFEAIAIETDEGKEEYVRGQRELASAAEPVRERLLAVYRGLLEAVTSSSPNKSTSLPLGRA